MLLHLTYLPLAKNQMYLTFTCRFYGREIRAFEILRGDVEPPVECDCLYEVLRGHQKRAEKELIRMAKKEAMKAASGEIETAKMSFSVRSITLTVF